MPTMKDLFTPIDELKKERSRRNSQVFSCWCLWGNGNVWKTPVMALDEGSRRVYGTAPEYQLISEVRSIKLKKKLRTSEKGRCQRKKLDLPQYSHKEEGPPNDRTFITTC
ncbi:hypothetical protein COOONC_03538 [Cooperia oncophora]